jgi:hypothetical protein
MRQFLPQPKERKCTERECFQGDKGSEFGAKALLKDGTAWYRALTSEEKAHNQMNENPKSPTNKKAVASSWVATTEEETL